LYVLYLYTTGNIEGLFIPPSLRQSCPLLTQTRHAAHNHIPIGGKLSGGVSGFYLLPSF
jgi:hypothetical protein